MYMVYFFFFPDLHATQAKVHKHGTIEEVSVPIMRIYRQTDGDDFHRNVVEYTKYARYFRCTHTYWGSKVKDRNVNGIGEYLS